jgi:type IV pilus assembly protein PilA
MGEPSDTRRAPILHVRAGVDERGVSGFLVMGVLLVVAVLAMVAIRSSMKTSTSGSIGPVQTVGTAADAARAQQSLSDALGAAQSQLVAAEATGALSPAALHAAEPSVAFTVGASTGPGTVSVFSDPAGSGAVDLAARSSDGTCWYLWWSTHAGTWYGAQTGQSQCAAPALLVAPSPAPVTGTSIGWQQSSFPSA